MKHKYKTVVEAPKTIIGDYFNQPLMLEGAVLWLMLDCNYSLPGISQAHSS